MYSTPRMATRFARSTTRVLSADHPLSDDEMRVVAPSIFAAGKHESRSPRYTYIPTIDVLRALRREGFEPFQVAQGASRNEDKRAYTKHLVRLRHAGHVSQRPETPEVILINSHDGASSYQMLAGVYRFVCCNGLIVGDTIEDLRVPHKGDVLHDVIEGAVRVVEQFETVTEQVDSMKALPLAVPEQEALATAALALRFGPAADEAQEIARPAPVTPGQLNEPRRLADRGDDLWTTLQRIQENVIRGGLEGRSAQGRRVRTRAVRSIDRGVSLNRALWTLAEAMRGLKG